MRPILAWKMFGRKQTLTLLSLFVGLLTLTLLAANFIASGWIPTIENTFVFPTFDQADGAMEVALAPELIDRWRRIIIFTLIVSSIFSLIMLKRYPKLRRLLLGYAVIILSIYFLVLPNVGEYRVETEVEVAESEPIGDPLLTVPEFDTMPPEVVGEPPDWFAIAVTLGFAAVAVFIIVFIARRYFVDETPLPLAAEIAQDAEEAIGEIEQGYDLRGAIIKAYSQMTETVRRSRGIVRKRAMTPSEFAAELQKAGLPLSPVERLTHLFEKVRYSPNPPGVRDQMEAVSCLGEIVTSAERIKEQA